MSNYTRCSGCQLSDNVPDYCILPETIMIPNKAIREKCKSDKRYMKEIFKWLDTNGCKWGISRSSRKLDHYEIKRYVVHYMKYGLTEKLIEFKKDLSGGKNDR